MPSVEWRFSPTDPRPALTDKTKIIWIHCGVKDIINSAGFVQKILA